MRTIARPHFASLRRVLMAGGLAISLAPLSGAARGPTRAVAYTLRVTSAPRTGAGSAAAMAMAAQNYTATAVFADGRGRLDVTAGGVSQLFSKGDFILVDGESLAIVHPATKSWTLLGPNAAASGVDQMAANGVSMQVGDIKVTLDSLAGADSVAGFPTQHFRMVSAFTMSIEAASLGLVQRFAAENTTDYWVADVPGLPANPLLRVNAFGNAPAAPGALAALSAKVDSAAARIGSRVALRTVTRSRLILDAPRSTVETQQTSEVSDIHPTAVDGNLLILPAGYRQAPLAGGDTLPASAVAPWRRLR